MPVRVAPAAADAVSASRTTAHADARAKADQMDDGVRTLPAVMLRS
jgi:hypothetical protein